MSGTHEWLGLAAWVLFSALLLLGSALFATQDLWWLTMLSFLLAIIATRNNPRWVLFISGILIVSMGWYVLWR